MQFCGPLHLKIDIPLQFLYLTNKLELWLPFKSKKLIPINENILTNIKSMLDSNLGKILFYIRFF
jgi:hypothetical protein